METNKMKLMKWITGIKIRLLEWRRQRGINKINAIDRKINSEYYKVYQDFSSMYGKIISLPHMNKDFKVIAKILFEMCDILHEKTDRKDCWRVVERIHKDIKNMKFVTKEFAKRNSGVKK